MKRVVICFILFSMTLHCASRLGILSIVYQQRHNIALQLGLIAEIPIALCSGDYDFGQGLVIQEQTEPDGTVPPLAFQTHEIHLFCNRFNDFQEDPNRSISLVDNKATVVEHFFSSPPISIFHPPS